MLFNLNKSMYSRSPLTKDAAEKTRDSLAMGLYGKLFAEIMQKMNNHLSSPPSIHSIGILDIAGFGKFKIIFIFVTTIF